MPTSMPTTTTTTTTSSANSSTSLTAANTSHEFSPIYVSGKKKSKRKNLSFIAESDGGVDTAEEEEFQEQLQLRKKRNKNLMVSDTEYDGKSADESNTDGGGKQSPDSAGMGKSLGDDKLVE